MRIFKLTLLGIFTISGLAQAQAPNGKMVSDLWDAAYLEGGKAGYVRTTVKEYQINNMTIYRTNMALYLKVKRFNSIISLRMNTGTDETKDGKVTRIHLQQFLGQKKRMELIGTVQGKQMKLVLDGTKTLPPVPWDDNVIGLYKQQTLLKDRKVKPGDKFTFKSFEPSINLVVDTHVHVQDYEMVDVLGGKNKKKLLRVETKPEKFQNVQLPAMISWVDKDLETVRSQVVMPGLGKLVLYRTTREAALAPGKIASLTDIGINQFIKLNRRIPQPYTTKEAVYLIKVEEEEDPQSTFAQSLRQSIKNISGDTFELHVRATASEIAEEPGAECLQSSYFIKSDDSKVKQFAARAVAGETDPWRKALRIESWVRRNMRSRSHEAMATADHVAKTLEGDCSEYSMLMAAMCRAAKIPSRTAIGLIYADVSRGPVFAFHMWTEVWIRGRWVPMDATLGKGYVGATHLKITDHNWHEVRSLTPMFPLLRVLGKVSIQVKSTKQK